MLLLEWAHGSEQAINSTVLTVYSNAADQLTHARDFVYPDCHGCRLILQVNAKHKKVCCHMGLEMHFASLSLCECVDTLMTDLQVHTESVLSVAWSASWTPLWHGYWYVESWLYPRGNARRTTTVLRQQRGLSVIDSSDVKQYIIWMSNCHCPYQQQHVLV